MAILRNRADMRIGRSASHPAPARVDPAASKRTGLCPPLAIAAVTGVAFAAFPELDLKITRLFYDPNGRGFILTYYMFVEGHMGLLRLRDASMWIVIAIALAPVAAFVIKLLRPTKPMLMRGRAIVFLLGTLALAPGVLANAVLKEHWPPPRPPTAHS